MEAAKTREQLYMELMEANSPYTLQSKVADVVLELLDAAERRARENFVQELRSHIKRKEQNGQE